MQKGEWRLLKKAYIEITNVCNLSCSFCPQTKRAPHFMAPEEFAHIAKQVKAYTPYVYLHLMGEPLLHPQLDEILTICRHLGLLVTITTNATLLSKVQPVLLKHKIYKIQFSLHSLEANQTQLSMPAYIRHISHFAQQKSRQGTLCVLRLWNMDSGELKGQNRLNEEIFTLLEQAFALPFPLKKALQEKHSLHLDKGIYLHMAQKFSWPDKSLQPKHQQLFCRGLRDHIGVLCDGTVVPCCLDHEGDIPLGNLHATPLQNILNSPQARTIYQGFSARKAVHPLCQTCGYATRF